MYVLYEIFWNIINTIVGMNDMIILVKFETNLTTYIEGLRRLLQIYI